MEAVRSNVTLEQISTVQERDLDGGPVVEQLHATMEHYLTLNRQGRRFLNTRQLLPGLWRLAYAFLARRTLRRMGATGAWAAAALAALRACRRAVERGASCNKSTYSCDKGTGTLA